MDGPIDMPDLAGAAQVDYQRADRCATLERDWRALEANADGSPFSSWPWVATWLATLPEPIIPHVLRVHDTQHVVALGLLVESPRAGLHRLLGGGILNTQQTGDPTLDEITVEYGGLLMRRGCETLAYAALFERLGRADLRRNDLHIPASSHGPFMRAALPAHWQMRRTRQRRCYVADLAAVRASGKGYLQHLSASTRSGLRQTRRAFEALGDIHLTFASDAAEALNWLEQLRELHQRRWHDAGHDGAFDSAYFHAFHRHLIAHHHASGLPRLCQLRGGDAVLGYYYHLHHGGHIYCYNGGLQTGLVSKNDRPGFLLHWMAIEHALADGQRSYDFLAGDAAYKRMLGTHGRPLAWIQAWRSSPRKTALRWLHRQLTRETSVVAAAHDDGDNLVALR